MFEFFKGWRKEKLSPKQNLPVLSDLHQQPLSEGDTVESLRYDLGICRVVMTNKGLAYQSVDDGRVVSWHLMVDASTDLQKVKKIESSEAD